MPEMYSTVTFNTSIIRIREQKKKVAKKTASEASKRGETGSLTEDGKLYRCHSFKPIPPSKIIL